MFGTKKIVDFFFFSKQNFPVSSVLLFGQLRFVKCWWCLLVCERVAMDWNTTACTGFPPWSLGTWLSLGMLWLGHAGRHPRTASDLLGIWFPLVWPLLTGCPFVQTVLWVLLHWVLSSLAEWSCSASSCWPLASRPAVCDQVCEQMLGMPGSQSRSTWAWQHFVVWHYVSRVSRARHLVGALLLSRIPAQRWKMLWSFDPPPKKKKKKKERKKRRP